MSCLPEGWTMFGTDLICDQKYNPSNPIPNDMSEHYFKSCTFVDLDLDAHDFGTVTVFCEFYDCEFYWTSFISSLLVSTRFFRTTFRGVSFAGAKIIDCKFEYCNFLNDNLGGDCTFDGAKLIDCEFPNTVGAPFSFSTEKLRLN